MRVSGSVVISSLVPLTVCTAFTVGLLSGLSWGLNVGTVVKGTTMGRFGAVNELNACCAGRALRLKKLYAEFCTCVPRVCGVSACGYD